MQLNRKTGTVILTVLLSYTSALAQNAITISTFSEATTVPFTTFIPGPLHPGIQAGYEGHWHEGARVRLLPIVNLGYLFHRHLFQGVYGSFELGIDYKVGFGLSLKSRLGLGYLHTFTTQREFQFHNGVFTNRSDHGNSRLMPSFTVGAGYSLHPSNPTSPEVFALYQSWVEYPYSPGFIPAMVHSNVHLGAKFYPFGDKTNKK